MKLIKIMLSLAIISASNSLSYAQQHLDDKTALELAPQGNVDAQAQLANAYLMGTANIAIDYEKAKYWAENAIKQGSHRGELVLGILYLNGYAVPKDYTKARQLLEQASQGGEMKAPRYLGFIYLNGWGVAKDDAKAAEYFQQGDANNDISSQYQLAKLYEQGKGVPQDYTKAIELYKKNSDRIDHITAPNFMALGDIYAQGLGVNPDRQQARLWYEKALQAGDSNAQEKLNGLAP